LSGVLISTTTSLICTSGTNISTLVLIKSVIVSIIFSFIPSNKAVPKSAPNSGLNTLSPLLVSKRLSRLDLI
jgi:hypothetical protein